MIQALDCSARNSAVGSSMSAIGAFPIADAAGILVSSRWELHSLSGAFYHFLFASVSLSTSTIVRSSTASFKPTVSSPSVVSRKRASATWCLLRALCTTLNPNLDKRKRQRAGLPDASARFQVPRSTLWSDQTLNRAPSRYGLSSKSAQTTAKESIWAVLYMSSASLRYLDQYPIVLTGPVAHSWRRREAILVVTGVGVQSIDTCWLQKRKHWQGNQLLLQCWQGY